MTSLQLYTKPRVVMTTDNVSFICIFSESENLIHSVEELPVSVSPKVSVCFSFKIILLDFFFKEKEVYLIWEKELQEIEREMQREKGHPSVGLLCKCSQQPGLCQAQASSQELYLGLRHGCVVPRTWPVLLCFPRCIRWVGLRVEQPGSIGIHVGYWWAGL